MNSLVAVFTAVAVLSHSLVGCCAHTVGAANCCDQQQALCGEHPHHGHSHVTTDQPGEESGPGEGHGCCRVKCQWLAPDAPSDLSIALLSYAAIFDADQTAVACAALKIRGELSPRDSLPALALRTHLALGVLLI